MSTPGRSGSAEDRQSQTFTKFMRRASKVLRPKSNRNSLATQSDIVGDSPSAGGAVLAEIQPRSAPLGSNRSKPVVMSSMAHMKEREEKARALFAKYGLKLEPGEWTTPRTGDTQWVEKKVVMRVHRQCHRCQTAFGSEKTCANCNHTRCKKCPRFPTKRPKEQRKEEVAGAAALAAATGGIAIDTGTQPAKSKQPIQLTMPSRFNQDFVRRHPVQRVRRTCHKCDTLFIGKAIECEGCKHQRCPNCPRDPYVTLTLLIDGSTDLLTRIHRPKTKKYPDGYPGDVEETFPLSQRALRPIRTRYRWTCHGCSTTFKEHEKKCRECEHERCEQCPRHPPKKSKPAPNPDVIKSLEEKMGRMMVSPATAT